MGAIHIGFLNKLTCNSVVSKRKFSSILDRKCVILMVCCDGHRRRRRCCCGRSWMSDRISMKQETDQIKRKNLYVYY